MSKIQKIKGFADLFPKQSAVFSFLEETAKRVFGQYSFSELRTPILEKTELFTKGIGEDTDVVGKEMFTFPDKKGRMLTLRPEATAGVVRAYVEANEYQPGKISRYFTFGAMFRYERPQKGRQRQFHQLNAEMFGTAAPQADAEIIFMLTQFLHEIGLEKLTVELNSLGCTECRPKYKESLIKYYREKDFDKLCEDCQRRSDTNPLRVLDCKNPTCQEIVKDAPKVTEHICVDCAEHFKVVCSLLDEAGVEYVLNPRLVRGLDYYQRTTFEISSQDIGSQTAVAGGGRYDGLVKQLGGADVAGIGFACGMERLALLLGEKEPAPRDFFIAVTDELAINTAQIIALKLRRMGYSGEASYTSASMKSALRYADKLSVKNVLILGADEFAKKSVSIKSMHKEKAQETVLIETFLGAAKDYL